MSIDNAQDVVCLDLLVVLDVFRGIHPRENKWVSMLAVGEGEIKKRIFIFVLFNV